MTEGNFEVGGPCACFCLSRYTEVSSVLLGPAAAEPGSRVHSSGTRIPCITAPGHQGSLAHSRLKRQCTCLFIVGGGTFGGRRGPRKEHSEVARLCWEREVGNRKWPGVTVRHVHSPQVQPCALQKRSEKRAHALCQRQLGSFCSTCGRRSDSQARAGFSQGFMTGWPSDRPQVPRVPDGISWCLLSQPLHMHQQRSGVENIICLCVFGSVSEVDGCRPVPAGFKDLCADISIHCTRSSPLTRWAPRHGGASAEI